MTASKRIFCLFTCVFLMFAGIITVNAEESTDASTEVRATFSYGYLEYEVLDDETLCITGYTGTGGDVSIPSEINGKTVTVLGDEVFWYMEEITAVSLPDTLEYIGARAFQNCDGLEYMYLPDSVMEIGDACFMDCSNLTQINVPSELVYVGAFAFDETPWITQFDDSTCIILGGEVFYKYLADEDMVVIPDGILCLSDNAFEGKSLEYVDIPSSVAFIGDYCFYNCSNLKGIKLPSELYYLGENSLGLIAGESDVAEVEDFTIYADDGTLGAEYAAKYDVTLKASSEFAEPESKPQAEVCIPGEIKSTDNTKGTSAWLSKNALVVLVLSFAGCVIIIGGITFASHMYEKKHKGDSKVNAKQKNSKKKKK